MRRSPGAGRLEDTLRTRLVQVFGRPHARYYVIPSSPGVPVPPVALAHDIPCAII